MCTISGERVTKPRKKKKKKVSNAYEELKPFLERAQAFSTARILFEWDNETLAPRAAEPNTTKVVGTLSG